MMRLYKTLLFVLIFAGLSMAIFPVAAQIAPLTSGDCKTLGLKCNEQNTTANLLSGIGKIINVGLALAGILAVIYMILGGVRYIMSQGEEDEAAKGKRTVLFAVIGLIVIGISAAIVNFVLGAIRAA